MTRMILGALFVIASLPLAATIAAGIGGLLAAPDEAGWVNPVIHLYHAALGAVIGGGIALVLAFTLGRRWLWVVSVPVIVIGFVLVLQVTVALLLARS